MGKPKRSGGGFSIAHPKTATTHHVAMGAADHAAEERKAIALINQGRLQEAEVIYRQLIAAGTTNHHTYGNLAAICGMQRRHDELIALLRQALQLNPNYPEAHNNLGNALQEQGDLTAAIASYTTALRLHPNYPEAHINLGVAFQEQGDLAAAIASYNMALRLQPNDPKAQCHLSMAELLSGDYKSGWERYEYRFQSKTNQGILIANPPCEAWNGEEIPAGSQLLLVCEQGLGDTLQFMRFAIPLRKRGIAVSLSAQPKLQSLIKTSGIDPSPLTPEQANRVKDGQWMPLLSVARYLDVNPDNPIITEPYIKTTAELIGKWEGILSTEQRPIIGINWQGNPSHEKTNSVGRSLPLETFTPIANETNASLLSLQKGFGSEQLETCSFKNRFVGCQDQINETWDFLESAAIIANCDLIITSDTSVAHLAGGMGKTTWLLLKRVPEWRWGLDDLSTFWYPCMRLFRQRGRGEWEEVMTRVVQELKAQYPDSLTTTNPAQAPPLTEDTHRNLNILAPISLGDLIDRITILQIKAQHFQGRSLENVKQELHALESTLNKLPVKIEPTLIQRLKTVNQDLWQTEDAIRDQELQQSFDNSFIRLARSVYQQNDRRAAIKKEINTIYGSAIVEEKSNQQY